MIPKMEFCISGVLLVFSFFGAVLYFLIKNRHNYWKKRNIPYLKPENFFLGSNFGVFFNKISLYRNFKKVHDELAPHKYGGHFSNLTPVLIIRDPDLIKNILIKDFDYFVDRGNVFEDEIDFLSKKNLFFMHGNDWKILRAKLTPVFGSSKLKMMHNLVKDCAEQLVETIDGIINENEEREARDIMARYTTDVVLSCIFGMQGNTQKNMNSEFRKMGKKIFEINPRAVMVQVLQMISPNLRMFLGITLSNPDVGKFFKAIVSDIIRYRTENNVRRNDFMDMLLSMRKEGAECMNQGGKIELSDEIIAAQCFIFFAGGYETSAGTLSFALFELAKRQDIQQRLFEEIQNILKTQNGDLTYESLFEMTYLSQVIDEILRMYPVEVVDRKCIKPYHLEDGIILEKDTLIHISPQGLHYDPQYYKNPYEFNPENFSKEAKAQRPHITYMPFGDGPRNCIGMRFGLLQMKIALAMILNNFVVHLSPKMKEKRLRFVNMNLLPEAKDGIWLNFEKRVVSSYCN